MLRAIIICLGILTLGLAPASVLAQQAEPRAAAIEETISRQLDAFNAGDVAAAWSHASPMIKGLFGSPENFGNMVRQGYPMVWSNSARSFEELREIGGLLFQRVRVRDAGGGLHVLEYQMVETAQGWQINGVSILPAPDVGV